MCVRKPSKQSELLALCWHVLLFAPYYHYSLVHLWYHHQTYLLSFLSETCSSGILEKTPLNLKHFNYRLAPENCELRKISCFSEENKDLFMKIICICLRALCSAIVWRCAQNRNEQGEKIGGVDRFLIPFEMSSPSGALLWSGFDFPKLGIYRFGEVWKHCPKPGKNDFLP